MPTLSIRDIPDETYQAAQRLARQQGRSLSALVITLLEQASLGAVAQPDELARRRSADALAAIRRRRRKLPAGAPDVVTLLRRMRGYDD